MVDEVKRGHRHAWVALTHGWHAHTHTPCTYWTRNGIRVYSVPGFLLRRQLIELLFSVLIIKAAG